MGDTIEQAARVIRDAIGHFRCDEGMAKMAIQALSDAGLLAGGERGTVYEVWQGDEYCSSADSLSDAQHYAAVYGQDAPSHIIMATTYRQPLPSPPEERR